MKTTSRAKLFLLPASFSGGLYCLSRVLGSDLFCGTRGCEIYAGYGLFGISFYLYGFVGFLGIFLLTLYVDYRYVRPLLALTLGLALLIDTLFLIYQTLLWPCSSCQVVALLIGICAFSGVQVLKLPGRKLLMALGVLWCLFFITVGVAVVKEVAFKPWALYGSSEAPVKIYFSPTCPACEKVVRKILDDGRMADQTGLYPIAKNREDAARLARVLEPGVDLVDATIVLGLFAPASQDAPALSSRNRLRLLSNKMALARYDVSRVPLILSPDVVEVHNSAGSLTLPIDKLWQKPSGNTLDTGCSTLVNDENCQ